MPETEAANENDSVEASLTSVHDCSDNSNNTAKWDRPATVLLIALFKKFKVDVKSAKNEKAWKSISSELAENGFSFTPNQCETRFKYLKVRYTKKVDNLGSKGTGEAPVNFDYLDEMNEIFGQKPNIVPIAIASSSRGTKDNNGEGEEEQTEEPPRKKSRLDKEVSQLAQIIEAQEKAKEAERERRHNEKLAKQGEAINTFKSLMEKLIDKL